MATSTQTRPARVIDHDVPRRRTVPEGWLRGLVSGVEAAVLSCLAVVVPAVTAYVATAAAPALGEASWQAAARTGISLWLLAHGGEMEAGSGVVTVAPLGLTLLCVAVTYLAVRRVRIADPVVGAFAVGGYLLTVLVASFLAPGGRLGALLGALVVGSIGTALAVRRSGGELTIPRTPHWVSDGLRAGGLALVGLVVVASGLLVAALVAGWDRVRMIQDAYLLDPVNLVLMGLAQLVFLPTLVLWALAWAAGPGFAVGTGTHFAPGESVSAPLPAVPLLGGLPEPGSSGPQWVLALTVVVGVGAGVLLHRRRADRTLAEAAGSAAVGALGLALAAAVLTHLAAGSIGPGRMSEMGGRPPAVAGMLLVETGLAMVITVVALHGRTRAMLGMGVHAARGGVSGAAGRLSEARATRRARPAAGTHPESAPDEGAATDAVGAPSAETPGEAADARSDPARADAQDAAEDHAATADDVAEGDDDRPSGSSGGWSGPSLSSWSRAERR
ncbi:DUF6350 family protein [Georgenia alba]|uniref:DUF6350 family protein n=1 Tax=Georgenia alba TaxID=2233858 RepID=A0ABW2QBU1_9MICO